MKKNKRLLLICIGVLLLLCIPVVCLALMHGSGGSVNVIVDPVTDSFAPIQRVDADEFMNIDGVLNEPEWEGKKAFTNRLSDDLSMVKANLSMITHMTQKGIYVGVTVYDTNIVSNGLNAPRKNSTLQLTVASPESNGKTGVHQLYMDAQNIVSTTNPNVSTCAYGVKVDGEINSGMTQKMTMELFLPWSAIGMEPPADSETAMVLLNPLYNAIEEGQTNSKQLRVIPYSSATPEMLLRFSNDGFMDADAEDAQLGNSWIGTAKAGTWDVSEIAIDDQKTDENTISLTGSAKTDWGLYHLAYLTQASASNYTLEATVIPYGYDSSVTYQGFVGFAAMLPGEKQVSMRMTVNANTLGTNTAGQANQKSIIVSRVYQDYQNGVYDALQVVDKTNSSFNIQEGVRLKFIKYGAQYFMYADDVLVWAGSESRGGGIAFPALFSYNCQVEYKDIRYVSYDGRAEEMEQALLDSDTCLVSTEVEGAGYIEADTIAVTKGGSATITVSAMPQYILTDVLVNGKSVMTDFIRNAFFEGTQNKYMVKSITEHTVIKAVFEQYEGTQVSGKLSLVENREGIDLADTVIYAYLKDGRLLSFSSAVAADGSYSISLPAGDYSKLYFVHSLYEQIFYQFYDGKVLKVGTEPLTDRDFVLTCPTFDSFVSGPTLQTGDWYILDNNKYHAKGNTEANNYNTAYFRDSGSDDFIVKTTVKAEPGAMVGVMMNGTYNGNTGYQMLAGFTAGGNKAITLFGWHGTARPVNWIGTSVGAYSSNTTVYSSNNTYEIVVARKGDSVVMYVNGVQVAFWTEKIADYDGVTFDMSKFRVSKVGLSIRGYDAATFSDYSYSTDVIELEKLMCSSITFEDLPDGVSVQVSGKTVKSGAKVATGKKITVAFPVGNGKAYCVTVNGKAVTHDCVAGVAIFTLEKDSAIRVIESTAYQVSGTVAGGYSGTVIATNKNTGAEYEFAATLQDGKYTISLPDGSYKFYFDCGTREGMRNTVTVNGTDLTDQNLATTYQKLYVEFMGGNPSANSSGMTSNGVYHLCGAKNGNSNTIGYFNKADALVNNFVIKTHVNTQGGEVGIMMYGYDGDKNNPDVLVHLSKTGKLSFYGWGISWKDAVQLDTAAYDPTSFDLCVVKDGNQIFVFIDNELVHTWDGTGELKISQLTDLRVGLLVRGTTGASFSNYSMSSDSSAIYSALARKVTLDLPEGFTVTAGGRTLKSGSYVSIGTTVTVSLPKNTEFMYSVTVNGKPLEVSYTRNAGTFVMEGESVISAKAVPSYTVGGSVPADVSGSVTATDTVSGQTYSYEDILADGGYSIRLPNGTYSLYFDCGKVEGMITGVSVSGAPATADLDRTYQKLTPFKLGDAGTAEWVLTDNGRYEVHTSNSSVNSVAMGWFADGVDLGKTDFVIHTTVESSGIDAVMLGLAVSNGNEAVVYGLNGANNSAQIRVLMANGWPGYQSIADYDRTNFRLTIVKQGGNITYFINGVKAASWTKTDYSITGWSNAKVGLGIYRMYDVTFSNFSYSTQASDVAAVMNRTVTYGTLPEGVTVSVSSGSSLPMGTKVTVRNLVGDNVVYTVTVNGTPLSIVNGSASFILEENCEIAVSMDHAYVVSGTVVGNGNGKIIATDATGAQQVFDNALVNGAYSIRLGDGTYRLYFECDGQEGMITGVIVNGEAVEVPKLTKTYQKLTPQKVGGDGTAEWTMTENGRYEVRTSNTNVNSVTYGWFAEGLNLIDTDFIIKTRVEAAGNKASMIGLVMAKSNETVVYGLNNSNYSAQIRVLQANDWPGYKNVAAYDRTDFELTIVKKGETITYYINGVQAVTWTKADYDFSNWTDAKVGLGFYRMYDVTFSDYSYSSNPEDVANVHKRTVSYSKLPEGVSVSADGKSFESGTYLELGTQVQISCLADRESEYLVTVNGEIVQMENGVASFTVSENTQITVTYSENGYLIIRDVYAWIDYPVSDFYPQFTKIENTEDLTYTYNTNGLVIDPEKQTVKALQAGTYEVTASSESFCTTFTVYAEAVDKADVGNNGMLLYDPERYTDQEEDRITQWNQSGNPGETTLFIGDSFFDTSYWSNFYTQYYTDKDALCLGIAGSTTYDWELWASQWLKETAPKNIVIHIGTNNLYDSGDRLDEAVSALRRLFTVMHYELPDVHIYWCGISKRSYEEALIAETERVNANMKIWCDERGYITYLDTASKLTTDMLRDGIHPKLECYSIFTEELKKTDIVIADSKQERKWLTIQKVGSDGTANWVLQDDGSYQVQTSNTSVNSISYGYFTDNVNLAVTDFVIKTRVQAAGSNAVMIGMVIGKDDETVVYGLNNANYSAQIRVLEANGWPGYTSVPAYDRTDFELIVVKKGETITYYIDGVQACQWTKSNYDFTTWTSAKVGIGIYRMYDVTFSDYSYTETTDTTAYKVSGTVAGNLSGDITVIDSAGNKKVYEDALINGNYNLQLTIGEYSLYFDCGETEGMITGVNVIGVDTELPQLAKTYQKLTSQKVGSDGTANWVLVDNGRYEVQTSNTSVNSISYGYFTDNVNLAVTDFVIKTRVQAAGSNAVMIGMVIGKDDETVVYGLNNANYSAQIRVLEANGWPGYTSVPAYDRTDFELIVVKKGETITYYIDGVQACQWTKSNYDFTTWTSAKVGIGIYRMYDVTFSDYSYTETTDTTAYKVSGTVAGNLSGDITVIDSAGNKKVYEDALINGNYNLQLTIGEYSLYFDCGETEGMITGVNVIGVDTELPQLAKTYQKLTSQKVGSDGTANWVLVDNGRYEVQTSNTNVDAVTMGCFADGVNLSATDFVIKTRVEAAGTNAVMMGLVVSNSSETVVYGLNNASNSAQIRVLMANGWPGYKNIATYDRSNFELTIVKQGTTVTYYINGVKACQWTSSDYNFSGWTNAKVGIGFYRMYDVTFSDYSYSTDADDIAAALS